MKKSEITNQDLLQAIQTVDQKIDLQKEEILAQVDDKIDDVLVSINKFADDVKQEFSGVKNRLGKVEVDLKDVKNKLGKVENRLSTVEVDLKNVKATINTQVVTKTYLDEKFAEFGLEEEKKHKRVNTLTAALT